VIRAVGRALVGIYNSSQWALELNNPVNQRFVEEFRKAYGRTPTLYASQGYDAALLLDTAIKAVGGDLSKKDELRKTMLAGFNSTRGPIKFSPNGYPIQNYYLRQVVQQPNGEIVNRLVGTIFTNHRDAYVDRCRLR
jgi:branched-chain amino acid transport system substrate-binding protein